jgi:16S rRNA (cytidine1402-2'-O)-methyltransferase
MEPLLFLVATPIGNLGDITLRAIETLKTVDWVVSEDTRKTGHLLNHFGIKKPQLSFHEHNEKQALQKVMALLREGTRVALVTNAGSPAISDPGFILVRSALEENIPLTAIPGPTALVAALTLSGLPVHSFTFRGFAPHKGGPRKRFLEVDQHSPHTLIYYESPYRLRSFLEDALAVFGDRQAAVANDLTKLFEGIIRDTLAALTIRYEGEKPRGEYTIVIKGAGPKV